jgi:hypothetical protein
MKKSGVTQLRFLEDGDEASLIQVSVQSSGAVTARTPKNAGLRVPKLGNSTKQLGPSGFSHSKGNTTCFHPQLRPIVGSQVVRSLQLNAHPPSPFHPSDHQRVALKLEKIGSLLKTATGWTQATARLVHKLPLPLPLPLPPTKYHSPRPLDLQPRMLDITVGKAGGLTHRAQVSHYLPPIELKRRLIGGNEDLIDSLDDTTSEKDRETDERGSKGRLGRHKKDRLRGPNTTQSAGKLPLTKSSDVSVRAFNWEGIHFEVSTPREPSPTAPKLALQCEYFKAPNLLQYDFNSTRADQAAEPSVGFHVRNKAVTHVSPVGLQQGSEQQDSHSLVKAHCSLEVPDRLKLTTNENLPLRERTPPHHTRFTNKGRTRVHW